MFIVYCLDILLLLSSKACTSIEPPLIWSTGETNARKVELQFCKLAGKQPKYKSRDDISVLKVL